MLPLSFEPDMVKRTFPSPSRELATLRSSGVESSAKEKEQSVPSQLDKNQFTLTSTIVDGDFNLKKSPPGAKST